MSTSASVASERLVITGCGIVSPIGCGIEPFRAALAAGQTGRTAVAGIFEEPLPCAEACYVTDFDVRKLLGKKGTSFLDRLSAFTIVTCGMALENARIPSDESRQQRAGLVLGSSLGSIQSISEFTRETLIHERPYLVNPVLFPNTVMNCAAGQAAIWHTLKGINSTTAGGQLSSLMALRYAMMTLRQGYAEVMVFGGAEAFSPQTAWAFHHAGLLSDGHAPLGEGCALFALEHAATAQAEGRTPLLEVLACSVGFSERPSQSPDAAITSLAQCIRRSLGRAGVSTDQRWIHSGGFRGDAVLDRIEEESVRVALEHTPDTRLSIKQAIGEVYSAAGAFQLAALLDGRPETQGSMALITSVGHDGMIGCAIVKVL